MIKHVNGNILNANEIICHQVNCLGVMGGGLALQIKNKWPEVYREYSEYCDQVQDPNFMLGHALIVDTNDGHKVANIFGQANIGYGIQTDYKALLHAFEEIAELGVDVAIPYGIGCGLAGGSWDMVENLIGIVFKDKPFTAFIYTYDKYKFANK